MKELFEFLLENWKELSVLFVALCTFIITTLKGKGKVDPVLETMFVNVPDAINAIEERLGSGTGAEKKRAVMAILGSAYKKLTGYSLKEESKNYKLLSEFVELVLSTPQKKEDK